MEVQITYSGGDFTDTNDKFALYEPRDIDAFDFFPVFANDKNSFYFCVLYYEYGFHIHFLTIYMIFIYSHSLIDHLTSLL